MIHLSSREKSTRLTISSSQSANSRCHGLAVGAGYSSKAQIAENLRIIVMRIRKGLYAAVLGALLRQEFVRSPRSERLPKSWMALFIC